MKASEQRVPLHSSGYPPGEGSQTLSGMDLTAQEFQSGMDVLEREKEALVDAVHAAMKLGITTVEYAQLHLILDHIPFAENMEDIDALKDELEHVH